MIQVNFSTSSLTYSQIWLSPRLVDHSQPTYITNLKKKHWIQVVSSCYGSHHSLDIIKVKKKETFKSHSSHFTLMELHVGLNLTNPPLKFSILRVFLRCTSLCQSEGVDEILYDSSLFLKMSFLNHM